jgi:hypothetical protein
VSEWSSCVAGNIVQVDVFGRRGTAPGMSPWHEEALPPIELAVKAALRTRYGRRLERAGIIWTYACRDIRGSSGHSEHSHPIALDVNPPRNPLRDDGLMICDFTTFGYDDGRAFVFAFLNNGFSWGATWSRSKREAERALKNIGKKIRSGRVDPMHFEYEGAPVRYERTVGYLVQWIGRRGPQKRVVRSLARARHMVRRINREYESAERARWEKVVELDMRPA